MRSIRQTYRQPIKALSGVVLIALAVAVLCVCLGQSLAAANMRSSLESSYTTVALTSTTKYQTQRLPQEALDWMETVAEENPDTVLMDSQPGLTSAYIPELHPENYASFVQQPFPVSSRVNASLLPRHVCAPYTCVMVEVTLTAIGEITDQESGVSVELRGTIDRVLGLEEGYSDPTGYVAIMTLVLPDAESLEAMHLRIGGRYLAYGMNYYDRDWLLRQEIAAGQHVFGHWGYTLTGVCIPKFEVENLFEYKLGPIAYMDANDTPVRYTHYYVYEEPQEDGTTMLQTASFTQDEMDNDFQKVSFSIRDYSEYGGACTVPTIVALDGDAEAFLSSPEGGAWQDALERLFICNQSFPVVGVDSLRYIGQFAKQSARIVEGRDFTAEELANGGKVCVISRDLALANGLTVGDTLTPQYYSCDPDLPIQDRISQDQGIINPSAFYYTAASEFAGEAEGYTIIGLYEQNNPWSVNGNDLYAFTPNTIFTPKTAVSAQMEYGNQGFFRTLVLRNGTMDVFERLMIQGGQEGLMQCYDQGYTELSNNLYNYTEISNQALRIGLVVYGVVLLLYLLLFPTRQGKTIATMASLGAERKAKLLHVNLSSLSILIPGTLIGCVTGIALRQKVLDELTSSADVALPLEMDAGSLVLIALAQLALAALLTFLLSLPAARNRSLMKKGFTFRGAFRALGRMRLNTWVILAFALVITVVLCGLHLSNQAEIQNYEAARKEIPVTVTVTDYRGEAPSSTIDTWVLEVMAGGYRWGLDQYLSELQMEFSLEINYLNGASNDYSLHGITALSCAPEISAVTNGSITWLEGYDASVFATGEPVCVVPEGFDLDADPSTEAQELYLRFENSVVFYSMGPTVQQHYDYECALTVVGTYVSSNGSSNLIYCPYEVVDTARDRLGKSPYISSLGGVLADNDRLEEFRAKAYRYFAEPDPNREPEDVEIAYALKIDDEALRKAKTVLENSIVINQISTLLVFILSAGAGFFLGFLMIRSRKREIILMRTLGKANRGIYLEFAGEQMLRVMAGVAIGGAVFLWQPLERLLLFVAIYFVGLSAALLLFLRTNLLTSMKEEE